MKFRELDFSNDFYESNFDGPILSCFFHFWISDYLERSRMLCSRSDISSEE